MIDYSNWDIEEDEIEEEIPRATLAEKRKKDWRAAKRRARKTSFLDDEDECPLHYYTKNGLKGNNRPYKRSERDLRQMEYFENQMDEVFDHE